VDHEKNIARLKERLLKEGANQGVVDLCDAIFANGVTIEALEKSLTRHQCERLNLREGKQFQLFLEKIEIMGGTKHICRLCQKEYKNHRDSLRHFRARSLYKGFTRSELKNHVLKNHVESSHGATTNV